MSVATERAPRPSAPVGKRSRTPWFHIVMVPLALLWLSPIVYVVTIAFRSFDDIALNGLGAVPATFTMSGFAEAFQGGAVGTALVNSAVVTISAVLASLFLSSLAAYSLSRYRIPFARTILLVMLAGNLLPPQILLIPVSRIAQSLGIYDTLFALIIVQVGFGLGFYTFVLHGFMRSLPSEVFEAAVIDGAGPTKIYWRIVLPLSRPPLAALAALATTWIFNDLIWAMAVLQTETKFPITAALLNLQGGYSTSWNVVAAGTIVAVVPPAVVFFVFQKQFVSGLLVGSNK